MQFFYHEAGSTVYVKQDDDTIITTTESPTYIYTTDTTLSDNTDYIVYEQAGASPAPTTDPIIGSGSTASEVDLSSIESDIAANTSDIDTLNGTIASLTSGDISITAPVATDGTITLIQGDDYADADGRAISLTGDSIDGWSISSVALYAQHSQTGDTSIEGVAGVVDGDTIRFELTATQTATMATGEHAYHVQIALSNGDIITVASGTIEVATDIPSV